jgi:hypothetical protein
MAVAYLTCRSRESAEFTPPSRCCTRGSSTGMFSITYATRSRCSGRAATSSSAVCSASTAPTSSARNAKVAGS